jgi:SOS-response transcriptional repressor LexA
MGRELSMPNLQASMPEWSTRVKRLIQKLKLSQKEFAERIGVSPATVTRWVKGSHEPTSGAYVSMGNLATAPDGIYFWERAGIRLADMSGSNVPVPLSSMQVRLKDFNLVASTKLSSKVIAERSAAVVLPLLNIVAHGDRIPPKPHVTLAQAEVEDVIMAPLHWCPHPESMISFRVEGDSMMPVVPPGAIIAVDTAVSDRSDLDQKLAVFSHRDLGFKVARLQRLPSSDILVSANHAYMPVDVTDQSKWRVVGQVLWWVSKDPMLTPASMQRNKSEKGA